VSFCTSPRTIAFGGSGIKVTGQAIDQNGVIATLLVVLNVDLAGPAVNVYSPRTSAVFPPGTPAVVVKGSAVDVLSGVSAVTCASAPATLAGQNFICPVPVHDGTNSIQIFARSCRQDDDEGCSGAGGGRGARVARRQPPR
jgi:hypothetical protein